MPYVPHTREDVREMLSAIGVASIDDLFLSIPPGLRCRGPLAIPEGRTEADILREMAAAAGRNRRIDDRPCFLGAGIYNRFIPTAVDALSSRGEFATSYTPYQPEASQGTLQAIFEYQTMIARLCGMEISNASMYDGATALAEAVLMAYAVQGKGVRVLVSAGIHPEHGQVLCTYFRNHPVRLESVPLGPDGVLEPGRIAARIREAGDVFAVAFQSPNFFGLVEDGRGIAAAVGKDKAGGISSGAGPLLVASVDPVSLAVLEPPGAYGADIALGDGQPLGNDPSYGGPSFGFFAVRMTHVRKVPGRIVGETRDREGRRGYVLTFQTREQHIRRERATSNICTNQGLACLRAAMFLTLVGERGLRLMAERTTRMAHHAFRVLSGVPGVRPVYGRAPFFGEFVLSLGRPAGEVYRELGSRGIVGGYPLGRSFPDREDQMLFACTELTRLDDVKRLAGALREILSSSKKANR